MSNNLTHWRKGFNPDYLGAYSLAPEYRDIILTIQSVRQDVEVRDQNGKKSSCIVAYFQEDVKPMILNVTNCKVITKLSKSEFIENWTGLKVQVFVAKIKVAGEMLDALRIRPQHPRLELPVLEINSEAWVNAVNYLASGQFTIEQVQKKYQLTTDSKAELLKQVANKSVESEREEKDG